MNSTPPWLMLGMALVSLPALAEPPQWTASPEEGIRLESADGRMGVKAGLLVWGKAAVTDAPGGHITDGFQLPVVRPQLKAHFVEPWIRLFLQPELAGNAAKLLDLELEIQPLAGFGFKVGQFIPPFSRSFLTPVPKLQFQGFTVANSLFRADRDVGAMLFGSPLGGRLEYALGVFNGNGLNQPSNDNTNVMTVARVAGTLFGRPPSTQGHVHHDESAGLGDSPPTLMVGASGYVDRIAVGNIHEKRTLGVDAAFVAGRLFAQAEGYVQDQVTSAGPVVRAAGADVQAGYYLLPRTLELAVRASRVWYDVAANNKGLTQSDALLAWNVDGYHLRAGLKYTATVADADLGGFRAGTTHALALQAQCWF